MSRVGGSANFSVFRYQHVGLPNAKLWRSGSKPMRGPNANGFVSQWNIGFTLYSKNEMTGGFRLLFHLLGEN